MKHMFAVAVQVCYFSWILDGKVIQTYSAVLGVFISLIGFWVKFTSPFVQKDVYEWQALKKVISLVEVLAAENCENQVADSCNDKSE